MYVFKYIKWYLEKSYFKIVPHFFCVTSIFSSKKSFHRKQYKNYKWVSILLAGLKEERNLVVELVNSHLTGTYCSVIQDLRRAILKLIL